MHQDHCQLPRSPHTYHALLHRDFHRVTTFLHCTHIHNMVAEHLLHPAVAYLCFPHGFDPTLPQSGFFRFHPKTPDASCQFLNPEIQATHLFHQVQVPVCPAPAKSLQHLKLLRITADNSLASHYNCSLPHEKMGTSPDPQTESYSCFPHPDRIFLLPMVEDTLYYVQSNRNIHFHKSYHSNS